MQRIFLNTSKNQFEVKLWLFRTTTNTNMKSTVWQYSGTIATGNSKSKQCICSETTANKLITVKWIVEKLESVAVQSR